MSTVAHLAVAVSARVDNLEKGLKKANEKIRGFQSQVSKTAGGPKQAVAQLGSEFKKMGSTLGGIAAKVSGLLGGITALGAIGMGVNEAMKFEKMELAFERIIGSTTKAKALIQDLRDYAATTPFQLTGIMEASQQMLAFGFTSSEIMPKLQMLGNVAAGVGAPLGNLARVFGKIKAQGRVMGEELNQMIDMGIPVIKALADHFGVAESAIKKMSENGQISFTDMETALTKLQSEGGMFFDMTTAQSKTLAGMISTLKDKFMELLLTLGEKLRPVIKWMVAKFTEWVDWISQLNKQQVKMIMNWVKAIGKIIAFIMIIKVVIGVIRTIISAYRAMAAAKAVVMSMSGPAGWAQLAVGAAVAATAIIGINSAFNSLESGMSSVTDTRESLERIEEKSNNTTKKTLAQMKEEEEALKRKQKALDDLMKKGESVTKSMRNPTEIFRDKIAELHELVGVGAISWDTYGRAVKKATDTLHSANMAAAKKDAIDKKSVGAVTRHSVAAFSAGVKSESNWKKMHALEQAQLDTQRQANQILADIDANTGDPPQPVNIGAA